MVQEDKGTLILGKNKKEFNIWTDDSLPKGKMIMNPDDLNELVSPQSPALTVTSPESLALRDRLAAINGIGEKIADEILEEYLTKEEILKAIDNGSFKVGGVGETKIKLIKEL